MQNEINHLKLNIMKTIKFIKYSICLITILFITRTSFSQDIKIIRTLEIEIFVEHNFESSKRKLMGIIDSTNASISSLIEEQAERGTKKFTVKLLLNNKDFETIDKSLYDLGYVKSKHLISEDYAYTFSTEYLISELNKLQLKKKKYEVEVEYMDKNNINYYQFKHELINLEQEISETEKLIEMISKDNLQINSINILMF